MRNTIAVILFFNLFITINTSADTTKSTVSLIKNLGCATCHSGLTDIEEFDKINTPDMGSAGLHYKASYLFDYLKKPITVKRHINISRMPDFSFDEKEALALTLYLKSMTVEKMELQYPEGLLQKKKETEVNIQEGKVFVERMCLACHILDDKGGTIGVELSNIAYRLNRKWVSKLLVVPNLHNSSGIMANLFFVFNEDKKTFLQLIPDAVKKIGAVTDYLFSRKQKKNKELNNAYALALETYQGITASMGKKIFLGLNCHSCHTNKSETPLIEKSAPDFSVQGDKNKKTWLESFLKKPEPLRATGFHPGTGSRMPNFTLKDEEVASISTFLLQQKSLSQKKAKIPQYPEVTVTSFEKILPLLEEKLAVETIASNTELLKQLKTIITRTTEDEKNKVLTVYSLDQFLGSLQQKLAKNEKIAYPGFVKQLIVLLQRKMEVYKYKKLSVFSQAKAQVFLKDKLSCLGCHKLGKEGGIIGPPLSNMKTRLNNEYIYKIIEDPLSIVKHGYMPLVKMQPIHFKTRVLITKYLLHQEIPKTKTNYISLTDTNIYFPVQDKSGRALYEKQCAICHGLAGNSDGINASFLLPAVPTKFADTEYMNTRPDDTLYDGTYIGAYFLNKSQHMPPWGFTLTHEDIKKIIVYLRKLGNSQGPLWSRDDGTGHSQDPKWIKEKEKREKREKRDKKDKDDKDKDKK
ncbi:c-type cytochrome [Candidatus Riflebacteria bacterium]